MDGKEWIKGRRDKYHTVIRPHKKYFTGKYKEMFPNLQREYSLDKSILLVELDPKGAEFLMSLFQETPENGESPVKKLILAEDIKICDDRGSCTVRKKVWRPNSSCPWRSIFDKELTETDLLITKAMEDKVLIGEDIEDTTWFYSGPIERKSSGDGNDQDGAGETKYVMEYEDDRDEFYANRVRDLTIELGKNPRQVFARIGKELGACCFCGHELSDKRSKELGYGPVCARHFGKAY